MSKPKSVKIRFYPILPRERRDRKVPVRSGSINATPLLYNRVIHWDQYDKNTHSYNASAGDFRNVVNMGNCIKSITKNPGWRVAVAKGSNATSSYVRNIMSAKVTPYAIYSENKDVLSRGYGQITKAPIITAQSYTPLIQQAIGQLRNKLNGHIGRTELAPPIAESREIHRMLRQVNTLALDAVKAITAIKKTRGRSAFKYAANVWLGLNFGVNPLLKDIEQAAKSIQEYNTREDHVVRLTGTASIDWTSGELNLPSSISEQIAPGVRVGYSGSCHHQQGVQIVAGINLLTRSTASYSVTDHLGLKLSELPSTLWELTPFSWAVDYFTTVSPWLDDMFYTLPGTTIYVSQATKYQSENTIDLPIWIDSALKYRAYLSGGRSVVRYVSFTRTSLSQLPSRSLSIKSVDSIASHGITKLLNLTSVLAQMRGPSLGEPPSPQFRMKVNPL